MAFNKATKVNVTYDNKTFGDLIDPNEWNENFKYIEENNHELVDVVNAALTTLNSSSGAKEIGATAVKEGGAETVQGILQELQSQSEDLVNDKVNKVEGKELSANDFTDELKAAYDTAVERAAVIKDITAIETEVTTNNDKIPTSNAVRKAIDEKVTEMGAGDMRQSIYDPDGDGVVVSSLNADNLGGNPPEFYATGEDLDKLTEQVNDALDNVSSTKITEGLTVLASGWVDETDTTALWRYRIENVNIIDNMIVNVHFDVTDYTEDDASSLVRATNAGLLAVTTSGVGYVDIYSVEQPNADLLCSLELIGYKVVE